MPIRSDMPVSVRYLAQGQDVPATPAMAESRMTHMHEIRERVEREQYKVDNHAVARALIERLLAGRAVAPSARD